MINNFEKQKCNKFRTRKVFSWFGFIVVNTIEWSGKFFKYVEIEEQLIKTRYLSFDEWNYQNYWENWKEDWEFKKFL